jgi:hypothetical protein
MSCPGLHCPGCSDGQSLGVGVGAIVALVLADAAVPWVADRIWWIAGTVALCFALATAASMALERRSDRRAAAWGAEHGILSRADVLAAEIRTACSDFPAVEIGTSVPDPSGVSRTDVRDSGHPAIGPAIVHLHFHGLPETEQAEAIRRALKT